ncbi:ABC transporter ATP-binding protein [Brucella tritici]|uniref:ABC transporter ATP-binding protein n=1 Tax=Brucella tritici TaxID=94626 RepID=UPI001F3A21ED|nr:ABC transporter ATP-binding protein [Brucella tritici]
MMNSSTVNVRGLPDFVTLQGVTKSYDGISNVVDKLDLEVGSTEFLTLLGPSGSGKTTILTMLAGFEMPSAGIIRMGSNTITNLPSHRRDIGVVFQNYALFPHMTVAENVAFPLEMRKLARAERDRRVCDVLTMVGLEQHMERKPAQLSGGQQQRVALARAIVFQPKLILMDEPLGALDNELRKRMQIEIRSLQQKLGVAVVFVTHDQSEALTMSDRVAVFNAGKIQQIDTPENIYGNPANPFVAGFIGETSWMNGQVLDVSDLGVRLATSLGTVVARNPRDLRPGDQAIFAVRPEDMQLNEITSVENTADVTITNITYLGDALLLTCVGRSDEVLTAKIHKRAVHQFLNSGSTCTLRWRADDTLAFRK